MRRMSARRKGKIPGTVYEHRDKWRAQVTLRTGRVSKIFDTEREAWDWLAEINDRKKTGLSASGVRMTFGELAESWMTSGDANKALSTQHTYRQLLDNHILPVWERVKLADLDPLEIETWLASLKREAAGGRTREKIYTCMKAALNWAVEKRRLGYNPMNGVEKPRYQKRKGRPLTQVEVRKFLDIISTHPRRILYTIAVSSGLREGELLGLTRPDIDWQHNGINVRHQAQPIPGQGMRILDKVKTDDSAAFVPLGLRSMVLLQEQLEQVEAMRTRAGAAWKEHDLVFPSEVGTPISPTNLNRQYKILLRRAGIDTAVRFHDLRHTSLNAAANELGAPVKATQKRARHSQATTTMNVYGGDTSGAVDAELAEKLDEWIFDEEER